MLCSRFTTSAHCSWADPLAYLTRFIFCHPDTVIRYFTNQELDFNTQSTLLFNVSIGSGQSCGLNLYIYPFNSDVTYFGQNIEKNGLQLVFVLIVKERLVVRTCNKHNYECTLHRKMRNLICRLCWLNPSHTGQTELLLKTPYSLNTTKIRK